MSITVVRSAARRRRGISVITTAIIIGITRRGMVFGVGRKIIATTALVIVFSSLARIMVNW